MWEDPWRRNVTVRRSIAVSVNPVKLEPVLRMSYDVIEGPSN